MAQNRFDDLSRSLASQPTRRRGLLAGGGGALLGLLGLHTARAQDDDLGDAGDQTPESTSAPPDETPGTTGADGDDLCVMTFTATVRTGPTLEREGDPALTGQLSFRLGDDAEIVPGESQLEAEGGNRYPVSGQTRGRAVSLRISMGPSVIVAVGTAEQPARSCAGELRGVTIGPLPGDLGDWVARAGTS
jgi:hypothetical protein